MNMTLYGMPIYIDHHGLLLRPRMQLTPKLDGIVTEEFKQEINAWMREFFGVDDDILQITDPYTGKKSLHMSFENYTKLEAQLRKNLP